LKKLNISYRIPEEKEVVEKALDVLEDRKEVRSLYEFHGLVLMRLKNVSRSYRLSPRRLLKLAAISKEIKIKVKKRHSNKKSKLCPLCGSELIYLRRRNLLGELIMKGRKCSVCNYSVERENLVPGRYIFMFDHDF